jgi:hypothetical protein
MTGNSNTSNSGSNSQINILPGIKIQHPAMNKSTVEQ